MITLIQQNLFGAVNVQTSLDCRIRLPKNQSIDDDSFHLSGGYDDNYLAIEELDKLNDAFSEYLKSLSDNHHETKVSNALLMSTPSDSHVSVDSETSIRSFHIREEDLVYQAAETLRRVYRALNNLNVSLRVTRTPLIDLIYTKIPDAETLDAGGAYSAYYQTLVKLAQTSRDEEQLVPDSFNPDVVSAVMNFGCSPEDLEALLGEPRSSKSFRV